MEGMIMEPQSEAVEAYEKVKVELPTEPIDPEFQEILKSSMVVDFPDPSSMNDLPDPFANYKEGSDG